MKITVEIDHITEAQKIALEDMFRTWEFLGNIGSSRWVSFFADGDGNFRPKILVDNQQPKFTELIDKDDKWKQVKILVKPNKHNGLKEKEYQGIGDTYMIDFDSIAWALKDPDRLKAIEREKTINELTDE